MRRVLWRLRDAAQKLFPKATLALLANRTWVLEPEVALIPLLARRDGIAVDAGANKGVYLFHMSRFFARVIAIEPLPALANYLKRAAPANVDVNACALSRSEGEAVLRLPRGFIELGSLEPHSAQDWTTGAEVEEHVVKLATLDSMALDNVSLIKIDVEGHELAVIDGARQTIGRCRPALLIEIEERHNRNAVHTVTKALAGLGYAGFYLDGFAVRPMSSFAVWRDQDMTQLSQSVKVGRYINNFLFFHESEAVERVGAIRAALAEPARLELSDALRPRHAVAVRERLHGSLRVARHLLAS